MSFSSKQSVERDQQFVQLAICCSDTSAMLFSDVDSLVTVESTQE